MQGDMNELRFCEIRAAGERGLAGTAVPYETDAEMPWGRERIARGAFTPIGDVILNAMHDRQTPLARTGGGGLELTDTAAGLELHATLPRTRAADDVLELVRSGVLRGLSIEFRATSERFTGPLQDLRVIEKAELHGVGVVDTPAYPSALVEARLSALPIRLPLVTTDGRGGLRPLILL